MIERFVRAWEANKASVRNQFEAAHPTDYIDLVRAVVAGIQADDFGDPDPERIHEIDDGEYQGTLVYVIGARGYQPNEYWYARISYGSCSGCDTLDRIRNYDDKPPNAEQVDQYMTLALHIVQQLKAMSDIESDDEL